MWDKGKSVQQPKYSLGDQTYHKGHQKDVPLQNHHSLSLRLGLAK